MLRGYDSQGARLRLQERNACAIYFTRWAPGHPENQLLAAVCMGEWGDGADAALRETMMLEVRFRDTQIQFMIIEPEDSPWQDEALLGKILTRPEAVGHPRQDEFFHVAEYVTREDSRVAGYLFNLQQL